MSRKRFPKGLGEQLKAAARASHISSDEDATRHAAGDEAVSATGTNAGDIVDDGSRSDDAVRVGDVDGPVGGYNFGGDAASMAGDVDIGASVGGAIRRFVSNADDVVADGDEGEFDDVPGDVSGDTDTHVHVRVKRDVYKTSVAGHIEQNQLPPEHRRLLELPSKGPRFEETHTKKTFWIDDGLLYRLEEVVRASGVSRSEILGRALRIFFSLMDESSRK